MDLEDRIPHEIQFHLRNMALKSKRSYGDMVHEYYRMRETHAIMDEKSRRGYLDNNTLIQIMYNQMVE